MIDAGREVLPGRSRHRATPLGPDTRVHRLLLTAAWGEIITRGMGHQIFPFADQVGDHLASSETKDSDSASDSHTAQLGKENVSPLSLS